MHAWCRCNFSSAIFGLLAQSTDLKPTGEDRQVHYQPFKPLPAAEG